MRAGVSMKETHNYPPRRGRALILLVLTVVAVAACLTAWRLWLDSNRHLVNKIVSQSAPTVAAVIKEGVRDRSESQLDPGGPDTYVSGNEENEREEEYLKAGQRYVAVADWSRSLGRIGRVEEAHAVAARIEDDFFRSMAYAKIAAACAEVGDTKGLTKSVDLAQQEVEKAQPQRQVMVFAELSKVYIIQRGRYERNTLNWQLAQSDMHTMLARALEIARSRDESHSRNPDHNKYTFAAYLHFANGLAEAGNIDEAAHSFGAAATDLSLMYCSKDKDAAVIEYTKGVVGAGRPDFAVKLAEGVAHDLCYFTDPITHDYDRRQDLSWRAERLNDVMQELARAGKGEETEQVAQMVYSLMERMIHPDFKGTTRFLQYESLNFSRLAKALAVAGRAQAADKAARATLDVLREGPDKGENTRWSDHIFAEVAENLTAAGRIDEALWIMRKKAEEAWRQKSRPVNWYFDTLWTARRIARALAEANHHDEARDVMRKYRETIASFGLSHEGNDSRGVEYGLPATSVKVLAQRGEIDRAASLLEEIDRKDVLDRALADFSSEVSRLALEEARTGKAQNAEAKLTKAYDAAQRVKNDQLRSAAISLVARGWAALGNYHRAYEVCEGLTAGDRLAVYTFILNSYSGVKAGKLYA